MTIRYSFSFGVEIAGADRLVLIHKVSLIMPLPVSYQNRLQQTKGVELASHQTWFGGIYQDPANFFANMAVEPDSFLKIYPEFVLPPEQAEAWRNDRQGAIIGRDLATRFGWKIGDRVPLGATIWQPKRRHHVGVQHRRHLRWRRRGRQDADVLPLRLPRREPGAGPGTGRMVRRQELPTRRRRWS